jgi:Zn-dependent peptidase ImmA (M78 family)
MNARVIDEICHHVPALREHAESLEAIKYRLKARNFDLACRFDSSVSMTTWSEERGIVRLAVNNGRGGLTVLFDLLHELGHVESGAQTVHHHVSDPDYRREQARRETEAWAVAEKVLLELGLQAHQEQFTARSAHCLATYGIVRH